VVDVEGWHSQPHTYDLISCLNVLDRCDCPLDMLRHVHRKLQPGGLLLLALVLPYQPFVEKGGKYDSHCFLLALLLPHMLHIASYPGLLTPVFVASSTDMGEGMVN